MWKGHCTLVRFTATSPPYIAIISSYEYTMINQSGNGGQGESLVPPHTRGRVSLSLNQSGSPTVSAVVAARSGCQEREHHEDEQRCAQPPQRRPSP